MPITVDQLAQILRPERTVVLFGSGASIPSGAPSTEQLRTHLAKEFGVEGGDLTLSEVAALIERKRGRVPLIQSVRKLFVGLKPTGGLLTIPRFPWKALYSTNYDRLVEDAFARAGVALSVYASNFDFTVQKIPQALRLMKLHGTIDLDAADGHTTRMIITEADEEHTLDYRDHLFDSLKVDLAGADLVVIGHSLGDEDIRELVKRAIAIWQKAAGAGQMFLLMYKPELERAELYEARGIQVCFGGVDEFAAALVKRAPATALVHAETGDPLDASPVLEPTTLNVTHALGLKADVSAMFNGWPARYADIKSGNTFARSAVPSIIGKLAKGERRGVVILGAGGVGKTTAARQVVAQLADVGFQAWEHLGDNALVPEAWVAVTERLEREGLDGVLFVDDANEHLYELNALFDDLAAKGLTRLRVVLAAARNHWNPRVKSPNLFNNVDTHVLDRLSAAEIDGLLRLVEVNAQVAALVDTSFMGFSIGERRRRLEDRCEREMFVCLKNIFASEKFDDIILREYATLAEEYREIYKNVAALESSGVRVHRQLIIRMLGIPMTTIPSVLDHLTDIVHEYTINQRDGIYGWRGRHPVIMGIITDYKFALSESFPALFERVIDAINPTFDIEVRTLRGLCEEGLARISDLRIQNRLLAKMISVAPGERVPRHRLIRNLIEMGQFEEAETEIRLFTQDVREDGPVHRYRVLLALERARNAPGLLPEDRLVILDRARDLAVAGVRKYPDNKHMLSVYCEVGIEMFKRTKKSETMDDALAQMRAAAERGADPEVGRRIADFEKRIAAAMGQ